MSVLQNLLKKGLIWSFIDNVLVKGVTFSVTIALARLLSPNDFGLLGVITIFISLGNALIEGGLGNSIVRDTKASSEDYNAVFYGNIIISILLYPLLFFTAPYLSTVFNNELITPLIRVYGISFLIAAFFHIQYSLLTKEIAFKKIAIYNIPSVVFGSLVGLYSAYIGEGVWSLVYMQLVTQLTKVAFYWYFSTWKPKFGFSMVFLKKHLIFGYKLMISSVIDAAMREVYSFAIGRYFSIRTLGFFNQSKNFRNYPVNLLSSVVSSVTFPLLSQLQEDKEKVGRLYAQILRSVFFVVTPLMISLIVVAKPLFIFLFTEKWLPAVPYFQLLAVVGILTPIHAFNINIFKIFNRTDLFLKLEIVKVVLVVLALISGFFWGIYGLLYANIASSILGLFVNTYYSKHLINYGTKEQLLDMLPISIFAFIAYLGSSFFLIKIEILPLLVQVILGSIITCTLFLLTSYLMKSKSLRDIYSLSKIILKRN